MFLFLFSLYLSLSYTCQLISFSFNKVLKVTPFSNAFTWGSIRFATIRVGVGRCGRRRRVAGSHLRQGIVGHCRWCTCCNLNSSSSSRLILTWCSLITSSGCSCSYSNRVAGAAVARREEEEEEEEEEEGGRGRS